MNTALKFTRYLYNLDEVQLTLLECILSRKSIKEIYFWTCELYYSIDKDEIWQLIYKIYYDFYFINYSQLIEKINKKYLKWKKNEKLEYLLFVIYNLSRCKNIDINVFLHRTYFSSVLKYIIRNVNLKNCYGENRYEKLLSYAIVSENTHFIAYYLKKFKKFDKIKEILIQNNKSILENTLYKDKNHLFLISALDFPKINNKFIYKKIPKDAYIDVEQKLSIKIKDGEKYKELKEKRLYSISNTLGGFQLVRSDYILNNEFWYNWEYHAIKTDVWKKRFKPYKIKISHQRKSIKFLNDDELEDFYEKYGLEPDEQKKEVQEKSTKSIVSMSISSWLENLFKIKINKIEKKLKYN